MLLTQYSNGDIMRFFSYLIAIIYRAYDDRGVDISYFRTCLTVVLSLFLHAVQIGLVFDLPSSYIMPWDSTSSRRNQWLWGFVYFGVLILLFFVIFKKSKIENIEISDGVVDRGRKILPFYLFFNVLILVMLLIRKKVAS